MSNKTIKAKKHLLQLGNFIVGKDSGAHDWVYVKSIADAWSIRFRDDNAMYGRILELVNRESAHSLLQYYINMCYVLTSTLPDGQFVEDFFNSYNGYIGRMIARMQPPTEEEENEAIEEMQTLHELQAELSDLILSEKEQENIEDEENKIHSDEAGDRGSEGVS